MWWHSLKTLIVAYFDIKIIISFFDSKKNYQKKSKRLPKRNVCVYDGSYL